MGVSSFLVSWSEQNNGEYTRYYFSSRFLHRRFYATGRFLKIKRRNINNVAAFAQILQGEQINKTGKEKRSLLK